LEDEITVDHIEISEDFRTIMRELRQVRDILPEVFRSNPDLSQRNSELFRIKDDSFIAVSTEELVIVLEPTERLTKLVTAARAWKAKSDVVQPI
jgi:hypothetical protein